MNPMKNILVVFFFLCGAALGFEDEQSENETIPYLKIVPSKPVYDQLEPILVRVYLVNPSENELVIVKPAVKLDILDRIKNLSPVSEQCVLENIEYENHSLLTLSLVHNTNKKIQDAQLPKSDQVDLKDPKLINLPDFIGVGGGRRKTPIGCLEKDYLIFPPKMKISISRVYQRVITPDDDFPDMQADFRWWRFAPGEYKIGAHLASIQPEITEEQVHKNLCERSVLKIWMRCRVLNVKSSHKITIIPCDPDAIKRWSAFKKINLGDSRKKVISLLGKPVHEVLYRHKYSFSDPEYCGEDVLRLIFDLNKTMTPESEYMWGKIQNRRVSVYLSKLSEKVVMLKGDFN